MLRKLLFGVGGACQHGKAARPYGFGADNVVGRIADKKNIAAADFFFRMHYLQTSQGYFGELAAVFAQFAADGVMAVEVFVDSVPLQF